MDVGALMKRPTPDSYKFCVRFSENILKNGGDLFDCSATNWHSELSNVAIRPSVVWTPFWGVWVHQYLFPFAWPRILKKSSKATAMHVPSMLRPWCSESWILMAWNFLKKTTQTRKPVFCLCNDTFHLHFWCSVICDVKSGFINTHTTFSVEPKISVGKVGCSDKFLHS